MNPKKGLIGLFILTFFLSSIGLALLVLDDQKDISSRADMGTVNNLRSPISGKVLTARKPVWDGRTQSLPITVEYDPGMWAPPPSDDPVFSHLLSPITVRVTTGKVDLKTKQILGELASRDQPVPDRQPLVVGVPKSPSSFLGTKNRQCLVSYGGYQSDRHARYGIIDIQSLFLDLFSNEGGIVWAILPRRSARLAALFGLSGHDSEPFLLTPSFRTGLPVLPRPSR
jgi:hypothetical protein